MNWIKNNQRLFSASFIIVLVGITVLSLLPPRSTVDLGNNDKLSHLFAYSVLTCNALVIQKFNSFKIWLLALLLCYGGLMEYLQGFVPGRVVSLWDIAANTGGILVGLLLIQSINAFGKVK